MVRLIATRLLTLVPLLFLITSVVFFMVHLIPGDPARLMVGGAHITPANLENIRKAYRLDRPLPEQYGLWVGDLLHGNLGKSYRQRTEVRTLILDRLPITLKLSVFSFLISLVIAVPLGIISAVRRNSWLDVGATVFALVGASSPVFFTAILLILLFAFKLQWLPAIGAGDGGWDEFTHLLLPSLTLGISLAAITTRITRSAMVEALTQDYIETARAKGLPSRSIVLKHALRNAAMPVVSVAAVQLGFMLGGSIVTEAVFALHGVGYLAWESISKNDFPVVQAVVLILAIIYIGLTLLADTMNAVLDPRLRAA